MKVDILDKVMGFTLFVLLVILFSIIKYSVDDEFYKENHYILKSCEVYKDKLENID